MLRRSSGSRLLIGALALALAGALFGAVPAPAQAPPSAPAQTSAPEFSFYGVKFGMTKAEIAQKWLPLSGGAYAVSAPAVRQIKPAFDHEGRLYEFSFQVDLQFPDDPATLVNIAFQDALNEKWKRHTGLVVNLTSGRDGNQVTLTHEKLRQGYVRHLQGKMAEILQP